MAAIPENGATILLRKRTRDENLPAVVHNNQFRKVNNVEDKPKNSATVSGAITRTVTFENATSSESTLPSKVIHRFSYFEAQ